MTTPFNAVNFRHFLGELGAATSNTFRLSFMRVPRCLPQSMTPSFRNLSFQCKGVDMPSRQLETVERRYSGPQRLIPYGHIYSTLNVEMIETSNGDARRIFDAWQESANGGDTFRPKYYDDIITDLKLDVFDKSGKVVRTYIMKDCFPISVNPSQLAWDNENSYLVIPIEISLWRWYAVETPETINR